jgi:hypothetical protein
VTNAITRFETVLNIYRYHKKARIPSDPRWADWYLRSSVATGYITQEDADRIRHECGEAVQNPSISTGLKG